jgi:hypothetical protein
MNYWQPIPISNFQEISSCLKVPDELRQASTYKMLVRNMVVKQLITTLFFIQTTSVTRTKHIKQLMILSIKILDTYVMLP